MESRFEGGRIVMKKEWVDFSFQPSDSRLHQTYHMVRLIYNIF